MSRTAISGALLGAVLLAGCAAGTTESAVTEAPQAPAAPETAVEPSPAPAPEAESVAPAAGSYVDLATYEQDPAAFAAAGDVVLFFNASWCPTCRTAVGNFTGAAIPPELTVVSVDYDDNTALRQRYGVTVQHTFVQVDASGAAVNKWTGSTTAEQVLAKTA